MSFSLVVMYFSYILFSLYILPDKGLSWLEGIASPCINIIIVHISNLLFLAGFIIAIRYIRNRAPSSRMYFYYRDGQRYTVIAAVLFSVSFALQILSIAGLLNASNNSTIEYFEGTTYYTALFGIVAKVLMNSSLIIICINLIGAISWFVIKFIVRMLLIVSILWILTSCFDIFVIITSWKIVFTSETVLVTDMIIKFTSIIAAVFLSLYSLRYLYWLNNNDAVKQNIYPSFWGIPKNYETEN